MNVLMKFFLVLSSMLYFSACSQSDSNPRPNDGPRGQEVILNALKYTGKDGDGNSCSFYIAEYEEEHTHEEGEEHGAEHELLIKVDYPFADGHSPSVEEAYFFMFNERRNQYFAADSNQPNTNLSLVSIDLEESEGEANPNDLTVYEQTGNLEQFIRIDFNSTDSEDFEESLHKVLHGESTLTTEAGVLDQAIYMVLRTIHGNHGHDLECDQFQTQEVVESSFLIGEDHDHD